MIAALRQISERIFFRISACNQLTKRLRYDVKRFLGELRKEKSKTLQHCFLNAEYKKWLCGLVKKETKTKVGERDNAKGVSQYPYRRSPGADPGEVKWGNFHPPFSEPPPFFFLIPQILK